jgi:phospholipase/lecithinase/hemolysin
LLHERPIPEPFVLRMLTFAVLAVAAVALTHSPASAFDEIVVFGDSLSDTGNAGRFSNGPVWVEGVANALGLSVRPSEVGGTNYAIGGARLDPASGPTSLPAQMQKHLEGNRLSRKRLYIVYGGGNDLIASALGGAGDNLVDRAVEALRGMLYRLAERGATDVLVPNLPDVGMTPAARWAGQTEVSRAARLTRRFNQALEAVLRDLETTTSVRLYRLDVAAMAERARIDPAAFGFVDVTNPCIGLPTCEGYVFWDGLHPTTAAHARLAEAALSVLQERWEPLTEPGH